MLDRFVCRHYCELGKTVGPPGFLPAHVGERIPIVYFAGDFDFVIGRIEQGNRTDTRLAPADVVPRGGHIEPVRRHAAESRDDHSLLRWQPIRHRRIPALPSHSFVNTTALPSHADCDPFGLHCRKPKHPGAACPQV